MKAYKVFNPDMTCRGFKYEVGKSYSTDKEPILCEQGFHACKKVSDCFNYYLFDPKNKVCIVELLGKIVGKNGNKQCSTKIKIIKEITWHEVLELANTGLGNTGNRNSGNRNSGNGNSGSGNSGDGNSGDGNSGYGNSGDRNSGNRNSGNRNSGDGNSGNRNSGDGNSGDRNSGHFNSIIPEDILVFNKPCNREKWNNANKPSFIYDVNLCEWISFDKMTDGEKKEMPNAYVCDGYLKTYTYKEAWKIAYDKASESDKKLLKALPNFNADVFFEITGIKV